MGLAGFVIWLTLLATAGICLPTRPRASGLFFILLGLWSSVMRLLSIGAARPLPWFTAIGMGVFWIALGARYMVRRPV